jgi:hypothetical protein
MTPAPPSSALAAQARRVYLDLLQRETTGAVHAVVEGARAQMSVVVPPDQQLKRRDLVMDLPRLAPRWQQALVAAVQAAASPLAPAARPPAGNPLSASPGSGFALVDDDTIEREILSSRLALSMAEKAASEFVDLRGRIATLERRDELDASDLLRPHVLARMVVDSWRLSTLSLEHWRTAQRILHQEFGTMLEEAYHETNRWLHGQGVKENVNLRPFIRRARPAESGPYRSTGAGGISAPAGVGTAVGPGGGQGGPGRGMVVPSSGVAQRAPGGRMDTRPRPLEQPAPAHTSQHAEAVLARLNGLLSRQVPGFSHSSHAQAQAQAASAGLKNAINRVQQAVRDRFDAPPGPVAAAGSAAAASAAAAAAQSAPGILNELQSRNQALKQAASTPVERATIEIVALMFQSLLTEDRIPSAVRVWFARLQMPVLRVAVAEPDFFATVEHPARKLIDRMGACVMGFDGSTQGVNEALEKEIKRVVQVVEAYPDTGRRVFQTVLTEFERFLEHYFKTEHAAARKGVSLAQQVEQRETLAIQYTIELRKMLNEVPVQEGVRQFLFQVWADVLATSAVKAGGGSEDTRIMKRAAADLIWSASAKVTREERAEVIRRLPPLLKILREGMASAGVAQVKQDEHIQALNNSLAAAFSARAATIPTERLEELMMQLEQVEELLPDVEGLQIDESMVLDLSGHESADLEVVAEGGSMPTPAMLAWASELQVGSWYKLDYRNRNEAVQLAWQGMRKQLSLFVTPQGRGVLMQKHRLAAFLQAGLLLPAEEEALTVRATRDALAKLDVDPSRLLH